MNPIARLREEPTVVLGIVIEVPQPWGDDLQEWRIGFGDNTADHMPTHITLVAPTRLASGRLDGVLADIDAACDGTAPFAVELAGIETFRPVSPVVFLAVQQGAQALGELHRRLRPLVTDEPALHPYVPHATVAMHVPEAVLDAAADALGDYSAQWVATAVSSYLRGEDGRWVLAARHQLIARPHRK